MLERDTCEPVRSSCAASLGRAAGWPEGAATFPAADMRAASWLSDGGMRATFSVFGAGAASATGDTAGGVVASDSVLAIVVEDVGDDNDDEDDKEISRGARLCICGTMASSVSDVILI